MKFFIKDFFNKCEQILGFLRIWSDLLKKSFMENLIFCAVRQALVFLWNNALRNKFSFYFSALFLLVSAISLFFWWGGGLGPGYNSMGFWDFPDLSNFPKILSLTSFGNSWDNLYIPCLLRIITLRFTCGEKKVW